MISFSAMEHDFWKGYAVCVLFVWLNVHSCGVSFRFVQCFALRDCISGTLFNGEHMNKFIINKEVFEIIVAMLETFTFVNDGICERLSVCESNKLVR